VMLALVKVMPETMQQMVNGSSMAHGSALVGAAAAVGGATTAFALGMAGGGSMAANAYRLASAQLGQRDDRGTAPQSRIARAATLTGYTAKNLAGAPVADVGRRLGGSVAARHGLSTWRMSGDLASRRQSISDDPDNPKPRSRDSRGNSIN